MFHVEHVQLIPADGRLVFHVEHIGYPCGYHILQVRFVSSSFEC